MAENLQTSPAADLCETYPISTVARLTGLTVHTIRAWEKRHSVVEPLRTDTQRRVYTKDHVRKLSLLRALVDAGQPISSIARLPVPQLEQSLDSASLLALAAHGPAGSEQSGSSSLLRVGVAGYSLVTLFESHAPLLPGMEVARTWESLETALQADPSESSLELLVVEAATLFPEQVSRIRDLAARFLARRVVIVYGCAPRETISQLNRTPLFLALRWPVNVEELRLAIGVPFDRAPSPPPAFPAAPDGTEANSPVPERMFTPKQLARLSRMAPAVRCECSQHLADLITSLAAFEAYSLECNNRAEEDAALHDLLHRATATARRELELALSKILESEGIRV